MSKFYTPHIYGRAIQFGTEPPHTRISEPVYQGNCANDGCWSCGKPIHSLSTTGACAEHTIEEYWGQMQRGSNGDLGWAKIRAIQGAN